MLLFKRPRTVGIAQYKDKRTNNNFLKSFCDILLTNLFKNGLKIYIKEHLYIYIYIIMNKKSKYIIETYF